MCLFGWYDWLFFGVCYVGGVGGDLYDVIVVS